MNYLKRISDGAVTTGLDHDSDVYRALVATKLYEDVSSPQADAATARLLVATLKASAVGADQTALLSDEQETAITVSAVGYVPASAITGADTNSRTISVIAGPDKASPISVASKAFTSGVNAAASPTETVITLGTAAVPAGEPIIAKSLHVGTGIADPGGVITVTYTEA